MTEKKVDELIEKMSYKFDEKVCEEAAQELEELGEKAVPALIEALSDKKPDFVRMYAAQVLKGIAKKDPIKILQAVPALIEVLENEVLVSAPYHLAHLIYNSEEALEHIAQKAGYKNHEELMQAVKGGKKIEI